MLTYSDVCARSQVKYDGIRPAPGYPSQPDHTEKEQMWQLLSAKDLASIELTESLGTHFTRLTGTKVHILTQGSGVY
jgi:cobalamin-dependent methionine synthase I